MKATIIVDDPVVVPIAQMQLMPQGLMEMARWVQRYRPQCVPEQGFGGILDLLPHDGTDHVPGVGHQHNDQQCWAHSTNAPSEFICGREESPAATRAVTDNELLCEFAGRKCYDSFADAGAKRSNGEYLKSMWQGRIPHRSTGYHAKMSFFIAHVSRRVSHELIRNYVGSDRDEEGSPSQESTRFTHHPGTYVAHPHYLEQEFELNAFRERAQRNYDEYVATIERKVNAFRGRTGQDPKGLDKKRIFESTSGDLLMSCGTSFIWTTNPMALTKFFHERDDESADMEMCRFARAWKKLCLAHWPNLFPDFHPSR